jgi:DNA primase catalytic subunit
MTNQYKTIVDGKLYPKRRDLKDVADELREWERTAAKSAMMVRHGSFKNFKETIY